MQGTLMERGPGRYRLRVYAGRDPVTGKKRMVSREFAGSKKAAETALAGLVTEVAGGHQRGTSATVASLLAAFLDHCERIGRSPTTVAEYRRMAKAIENGAIGTCPLSRLTPKHLDDLYARLATVGSGLEGARGPLSPASVNRYHDVIKAACRQAVKWGWLDSSPADRATPPLERRKKVDPPTPAELEKMIKAAAARGAGQGVLLAMAATTGGRRGELCALRWSDVDLDRGEISISRAIQQVGPKLYEGDTKTHAERLVAISAALAELLRGYRASVEDEAARAGVDLAADPYLFSPAMDYSRPYKPDTISNSVGRLMKELGGTHFHLHQLRHFAATQAIAAGADVATVSKRLGHSTTAVTLDIYTHVLQDRDREVAESLGAVVAMPQLELISAESEAR